MADQKLTQLTEMTTPSDDDLMYMVDNPGGTPASRKITWANIKANIPSGAVDAVFGRTGLVLASDGDYNAAQVNVTGGVYNSETVESALDLIDDQLGTKQPEDSNLTAIAALTWAANSIILLTGVATASVQALAAHIVTLLQSADAAGARTAIGAASLGANTFTGEQNLADQLLTRPVIKDYGETVNAIGSAGGGTQDIDLTLGNVASATVDTSETTFTFSNPSASGTSCSFTLILTNGGSQTVNWPASVTWAGGTEPTLTASGVDVLTFFTTDAGTTWRGFAAGLDMS